MFRANIISGRFFLGMTLAIARKLHWFWGRWGGGWGGGQAVLVGSSLGSRAVLFLACGCGMCVAGV